METKKIEIIHSNLTEEQIKSEHEARLIAATAAHRRDMVTTDYMESTIKEMAAQKNHRQITKIYIYESWS